MPVWKGKGIRATDADIDSIAADAGLEPAVLRAFRQVEAPRGPFDDQGRVTILYERHYFHKRITPAQRKIAGELASPTPGGYGSSASQYGKLQRAFAINERAALESCSWGSGQIMGSNFAMIGYASPAAMVEAFAQSEVTQIEGIVAFLKASRLIPALKAKDWARVARGYNGPGYADHNYHGRLAAAYAAFRRLGKASPAPTALAQIKALGFASVADFQKAKGLKADGIVGPITLAALKVA